MGTNFILYAVQFASCSKQFKKVRGKDTYVCTLPCVCPVCRDLYRTPSSTSLPAQHPRLKFQRRQKQEVLHHSLLPLRNRPPCLKSLGPVYYWLVGVVLWRGSRPGSYQQHSQEKRKMNGNAAAISGQFGALTQGTVGVGTVMLLRSVR